MSVIRWVRSVSLVPTKLSRCSAQKYCLTNRYCVVTAEKVRLFRNDLHLSSNIAEGINESFKIGTKITIASSVLVVLSWIWYYKSDMNKKVMKKFEKPDPAPLIREGYHFPRKEEDEIRKAFLNQTDTLGLVGVVFGPAGTGKSNLVRTVCKDAEKGVVYMEIGSPRKFPYHLAKACGVPIEPNWLDTIVTKLFAVWKTHITLPESEDENALALVLPVIANGGKAYKDKHRRVPVLFIDGVDILAKQKNPADQKLYLNLVDWAKKCANEDSLRIVFVCSDSHILALDQQSFKSRLDDLIEIDDIDETEAMELMKDKYGFSDSLARSIYEIIGGRLADIHKVVAIWRKKIAESVDIPKVVVPKEVVHAVKDIRLEKMIWTAINVDIKDSNGDKSDYIHNVEKRNLVRKYTPSKSACQKVVDVVNDIRLEQDLQTAILDALKNTSMNSSTDHATCISDISRRELICDIIRTNNFRNCWETFKDKTVVISKEVEDAIKTTTPQELQTIVFDKLKSEIKNPNEDKSDDIKDAAMKGHTRDIIRAIIPQEVVIAVSSATPTTYHQLQAVVLNSLKTIANPYEDKSEGINDPRMRELVRSIIRRQRKYKVVVPQEVVAGVNEMKDLQSVICNVLKKCKEASKDQSSQDQSSHAGPVKPGPVKPGPVKDQSSQDQSSQDQSSQDQLKRIRDIIGTYMFSDEIKQQFQREMRQALYNALADKGELTIKNYIVGEIVSKSNPLVEDVAFNYKEGLELQAVKDAIQELLHHNVLRITKHRTLLPYSKMAGEVLEEYNRQTAKTNKDSATAS